MRFDVSLVLRWPNRPADWRGCSNCDTLGSNLFANSNNAAPPTFNSYVSWLSVTADVAIAIFTAHMSSLLQTPSMAIFFDLSVVLVNEGPQAGVVAELQWHLLMPPSEVTRPTGEKDLIPTEDLAWYVGFRMLDDMRRSGIRQFS
jgi:hypothetical protein